MQGEPVLPDPRLQGAYQQQIGLVDPPLQKTRCGGQVLQRFGAALLTLFVPRSYAHQLVPGDGQAVDRVWDVERCAYPGCDYFHKVHHHVGKKSCKACAIPVSAVNRPFRSNSITIRQF
jgi:hypothetical protein